MMKETLHAPKHKNVRTFEDDILHFVVRFAKTIFYSNMFLIFKMSLAQSSESL